MNDWACRYCEHLKPLNKPGAQYVGGCEFRLSSEACDQFELAECFNGKDPRQLSRDDVVEVIAKWIEPYAIADLLISALEEHDIKPTVEDVKRLWLNVLMTELSDGIRASATKVAKFLAELNA